MLASIRDKESLKGAQYALPPGKIAITQGFFPVEDLVHYCKFDNEKTEEELITECPGSKTDYDFNEFFVNFEGSTVPKDDHHWTNVSYPIERGRVHVAIGADGLLRAVAQWDTDSYTGAIYQCCPALNRVCNVPPPPPVVKTGD